MKEYFYFNRRERNGIFVLLIILLFTQVLQAYVKLVRKVPSPQITYLSLDQATQVDTMMIPKIHQVSLSKEKQKKKAVGSNPAVKAKPNHDKKSSKVSQVEKFKQANQVVSKDTTRYPSFKRPENQKVRVDVNSSGIKRLQQVKGIGPVLSKRIVKYRNLVGGFHSVDQLEEVYGIDEEVMEGIKDQLWINTTELNKINIFTASVDSLSSHFYISERTAKTIKAYLASTNKQKVSADELLALDGVWYEATKKAMPYLILSRENE